MPLVVPGLMSSNKDNNNNNNNDRTSDWMNKLTGKKLGDVSNETTFAKKDLPSEVRVLKEGDMKTMDFKPERLNVHTAADGTVTRVEHG